MGGMQGVAGPASCRGRRLRLKHGEQMMVITSGGGDLLSGAQ